MRNKEGIQENLKLIEPNKGMDTLGILLAPDGLMEDEYKYLLKKSK